MKKKKLILLLLVLAILGALNYVFVKVCLEPSVMNNKTEIRVFTGKPMLNISTTLYKYNRHKTLEKIVNTDPEKEFECLITFNRFLSSKQVGTLVVKANLPIQVEKIWMAKPNCEGMGTSRVMNNNIDLALKSWSKDMEEDLNERRAVNKEAGSNIEGGNAYIEDIVSVTKNNKPVIYAMLVKGNITEINKLKSNDSVLLADIHYSEEAEKLAEDTGANVRYIDIPKRPDNLK